MVRRRVANRLLGLLTAIACTANVPVWSSTAAPSAIKTGTPQESHLANGLRLITIEDHSFPVVACFVWYHVGARNEQPGLSGMSHVVEHMLFQNIGSFKNSSASATLAAYGAKFNGYTSEDFTTFYELVHPSKLDLALSIEAARMRMATFEESALREEVSRVQSELSEENRDQFSRLSKEVRATSFREHPNKNPLSGWSQDLSNITIGKVREFYNRYYNPSNATIVLVGDLQAAAAQESVNKYFGNFSSGNKNNAEASITEPQQMAERRVIMHERGKPEIAMISYHAPAYNSPDAPAMVVLEKVLSAHFNGRIKKDLLDTKTCKSASSEFELKKDPGLFNVYLTPADGHTADQCIESWDEISNKLRNQLVTDAELIRARNLAEYAVANDKDGPYRFGFYLGLCDSMDSFKSADEWAG
ncbi:MAG TPA: pitrilysin family protein, partial [Chroococcales cyanobacterium]